MIIITRPIFIVPIMPDAQYHWGSHEVKSNAGLDNLDFVTFAINPAQASLYMKRQIIIFIGFMA